MKRAHGSAGFTLAEMLVALFITGIISAAGASLLVNASQSGKRLGEFSDDLQSLEVAQALVRSDFASMVPIPFDPENEIGVAGGLAWKPYENDGTFLSFYRNGWLHSEKQPTKSDLQGVEYALEDGELIRRAHLPSLRKEEFPSKALFSGVEYIELQVLRGTSWEDEPHFNSFEQAEWPKLIQMTVHFEDDREFEMISLCGARE